jgi:hypothetical protein
MPMGDRGGMPMPMIAIIVSMLMLMPLPWFDPDRAFWPQPQDDRAE